jgi:hypothetical protein
MQKKNPIYSVDIFESKKILYYKVGDARYFLESFLIQVKSTIITNKGKFILYLMSTVNNIFLAANMLFQTLINANLISIK